MKQNTSPWLNHSMAVKIHLKSKKAQTGVLKATEIKEAKILRMKFIQITNFSEAFKETSRVTNKKDSKRQFGIQLHEYSFS